MVISKLIGPAVIYYGGVTHLFLEH